MAEKLTDHYPLLFINLLAKRISSTMAGVSPQFLQSLVQSTEDRLRASRFKSNASSSLTRMPQELRDCVISMTMPSHIHVDPWCVSRTTPYPKWLQVCSQLRLDAAQVYYGTPIFLPWTTEGAFKKWSESIASAHRPFIKAVHIDRFEPKPENAIEQACNWDQTGGFKPGTTWIPTSVGETGDATSIWTNALGKEKLYEEMLPLEAAEHSAFAPKNLGFNYWD